MTQLPVLIIGATSDIGRAIAREYAKTGRDLVLAARAPERLARDAEDLRLRGAASVRIEPFDILDGAAHASLLDRLTPFPGTVISVVGLLGDQAISERDPAAAERVMRTNYLAPALLLGAVAERMLARGSGTIIGISSVAGDRGRASNYIYGSAKAGFSQFLGGLRHRLAASPVRVITVKPGFVDTRMTEGMKLPALLTAQPEEVARAIVAAEATGRGTIYVRPIWRLIMLVIRLLPDALFNRLKL